MVVYLPINATWLHFYCPTNAIKLHLLICFYSIHLKVSYVVRISRFFILLKLYILFIE